MSVLRRAEKIRVGFVSALRAQGAEEIESAPEVLDDHVGLGVGRVGVQPLDKRHVLLRRETAVAVRHRPGGGVERVLG